jgi:DnaJ homolog subfamily A member 2
MPSYRHHDFGNMFIQFNVKFPEKGWLQDPNGFDALRQLLPAPAVQNVPPQEAVIEAADLEDLDGSSNARAFGGANGMAMDEDEEEGHAHGGERVQCATQ